MFMLLAVEDDAIIHLIISKAIDLKCEFDQTRRIKTPQKVILKNAGFAKISEQYNLFCIC